MTTQTLEPTQVKNLQQFVAEAHEKMARRVELIMSITAKSRECTSIEQYVLFTFEQINKIYGVITDNTVSSVLVDLTKYDLIPEALNPWDDCRTLHDPRAEFDYEAFCKGLTALIEQGKIVRSDDVYMGYEIV